MTEHVFELIFVVLMIFSGISMITYAQSKKGEKSWWFCNPIEIIDYVKITRKESGKIGIWFWIFIISISFLVLH